MRCQECQHCSDEKIAAYAVRVVEHLRRVGYPFLPQLTDGCERCYRAIREEWERATAPKERKEMKGMTGNELGIIIRDSRVVVSSRDVARVFGKPHCDVLKSIRALGCSEEFAQGNFSSVYNTVNGAQIGTNLKEVLLTRDGFTLLAMGYTGSKAMEFKEAYIAEFNRMEAEIKHGHAFGMDPGEIKKLLTSPDALLQIVGSWKAEEEMRKYAEQQRDEAVKTKALIGTHREASAMGKVGGLTRKVQSLENRLGEGQTWKTVKAISWIPDVFQLSDTLWSVVGRKLTAISKEIGKPVHLVPSKEYGDVHAYHVDAITEFGKRLEENPDMLGKYRKVFAIVEPPSDVPDPIQMPKPKKEAQ